MKATCMKSCHDWTSVIIGTSDGLVSIRDVRDLRGGISFTCSKGRSINAVCKLDSYHDSFTVAIDDQLTLWDRRFPSSPVSYFSDSSTITNDTESATKKVRHAKPWFQEVERSAKPCRLRNHVQWTQSYDHLVATGFRDGIVLHCPRSGLQVHSATFPLGSCCALVPGLASLFKGPTCPVAVGDLNGRISLYDLKGSKQLWQEEHTRGHIGPVVVMKGSFNSNLISAGSDGIVCDRSFKLVTR